MSRNHTGLLKKLIRMHQVTSDVAAVNAVADEVAEFLKNHGVATVVENIDGRKAVYASTRPGKVQNVLFCAHLDVVPAMNVRQFEPYVKNGFLFGRGAGDCLGNVVSILQALIRAKGRYSAGAVFNSDEETGGFTATAMLERGYGAEKVIVVADHYEDCKITYRQKGILNLSLTAHGKGGHAAYVMEHERNPIDLLAEAYRKIRSGWHNPSGPNDWRDSLNGTVIHGGNSENQVPDEAEMLLNIRYVTPDGISDIIRRVRELAGEKVEIQVGYSCPPVSSNPDAPEIQTLKKCCESVFPGLKFGFAGMCGATDASHFITLKRPLAVTGVKTFGAHSAEESVELDSIDRHAEIYFLYMKKMSGGF